MSWFSGLVSSVAQSFDGISEDLHAFVSSITSDTEQVIHRTAQVIREQEQGGQSIAQQMTGVVEAVTTTISATSSAPERPRVKSSKLRTNSSVGTTLHSIQHNQSTYATDPVDISAFENWCSAFDVTSRREVIIKLMAENEDIRQYFADLVPRTTSYNQFWHRYFFKVHSHEESERKRKALLDRMQQKQKQDDLEFSDWDDDEEDVKSQGSSAPSAKSIASAVSPANSVITTSVSLVKPRSDSMPSSDAHTEYEIDHIFDEINKGSSIEDRSGRSSSASSPRPHLSTAKFIQDTRSGISSSASSPRPGPASTPSKKHAKNTTTKILKLTSEVTHVTTTKQDNPPAQAEVIEDASSPSANSDASEAATSSSAEAHNSEADQATPMQSQAFSVNDSISKPSQIDQTLGTSELILLDSTVKQTEAPTLEDDEATPTQSMMFSQGRTPEPARLDEKIGQPSSVIKDSLQSEQKNDRNSNNVATPEQAEDDWGEWE